MKKLFTFCLSMFLCSMLVAQVQVVDPAAENIEIHANIVAKELTQMLDLDDTQFKHVRKIAIDAGNTYDEIAYLQESNPELYGLKLESLIQHTDARILKILSTEQQISYKGIMEERLAAIKQMKVKQQRLELIENQ